MEMSRPLVSIIMGVYNGEPYLSEALESILAQTYDHWECIIIDDCSEDRTHEILEYYSKKEPRFKIYRNEKNERLPFCLNKGIGLAGGTYIVRMDADDISRLDRLELQVRFMECHPELALSCCRWFALEGESVYPVAALRRNQQKMVKGLFLFFNPINHSGVIAKRTVMSQFLYDPHYSCTEDLELWTRLIMAGEKIAFQNEYLLLYRIHEGQTTVKLSEKQLEQYGKLICRFYEKLLFPLRSEQRILLKEQVYIRNTFSPEKFGTFLKEIRCANRQHRYFLDRSVRYAACEFLMTRRKLADNKGRWLCELLKVGPCFLTGELVRRRIKKFREGKVCLKALEQFCAERKKKYGKKRFYWNV